MAAKHLPGGKSLYCTFKIFFSAHQKIAFVLQKEQLAHFLILSQLLAHCADLSKSEGQLCCCHETSLKPLLSNLDNVCYSTKNRSEYIREIFGPFRMTSQFLGLDQRCPTILSCSPQMWRINISICHIFKTQKS